MSDRLIQLLYNQHQIDSGDILKCGKCGNSRAFDEICINHGVCDECLEEWLDNDGLLCQHGIETEDDCRKRINGESIKDIIEDMEHYSQYAVTSESEKSIVHRYAIRIRTALERSGYV